MKEARGASRWTFMVTGSSKRRSWLSQKRSCGGCANYWPQAQVWLHTRFWDTTPFETLSKPTTTITTIDFNVLYHCLPIRL